MELDQRQQAIAWTFILSTIFGWAYEVTEEALVVTIDIGASQEILDLLALDGESPDRIEAKMTWTWDLKEGDDQ